MKIYEYIPGIIVVLIIAALSFYISTLHASFDSLAISIIIGMFTGNIIGVRNLFEKGSEALIKFVLPAGIALYGTQLVFRSFHFVQILSIVLVVVGLFSFSLLIANIFRLRRNTSLLLASGLAICGASAIAIISPLIGAKKEDTSISVISVMMLGLIGMIFYPIISDIFTLTRSEFSFLAGTTLPMLGQVKVAAASVSSLAVSDALDIKLIRVSFLLFLVTLQVLLSRRNGKKGSVPWFVIGFIVLAVLVNTVKACGPLAQYCRPVSSFFLSAGLAAIGFSVDFDSIVEEGIAPFSVIFIAWSTIILMLYLIRNIL